jgi:hypothetical protein
MLGRKLEGFPYKGAIWVPFKSNEKGFSKFISVEFSSSGLTSLSLFNNLFLAVSFSGDFPTTSLIRLLNLEAELL